MLPGGRHLELSTSRLTELQDRLRAVQAELDAFHDVASTILQGAQELFAEVLAAEADSRSR